MTQRMSVGFLGLGSMGSAIVEHLLAEGIEVTVWNRSRPSVDAMVALGAIPAPTPGEVLRKKLSISMLADDHAVDCVVSAAALTGAPGRTHVCMASISPTMADELALRCQAHEIAYLAAPVLGRPPVAAIGQLDVIAGGSMSALSAARAVLSIIGRKTWHVGAVPRAANVVKIAVNYNIIHTLEALGESMALIEAHGGSGTEFGELLSSTLFGGAIHGVYGPIIAERRYRPAAFTLDLGLKDLRLVQDAAAEAGIELPSAAVLGSVFERALAETPLDGADWASIAEVTRRQLLRT